MKLNRYAEAVGATLARLVGLPTRSVATESLAVGTWLRELRQAPLSPIRGTVALLAIRNATWIGFAAYAACWMRKLGYAPVILYSASDVRRTMGAAHRSVLYRTLFLGGFWRQVARIPDVRLIDLDTESAPSDTEASAFADFAADYAQTCAAYDLRVEEDEQEARRGEYQAAVEQWKPLLARFAAVCHRALSGLKADGMPLRFVSYSGLIGLTSAAAEAARRAEVGSAFVEGWAVKPGHMLVSVNQPAMVYDIRGWLKAVGPWDEKREQEIAAFLAFQETSSVDAGQEWLTNYHRFQRARASDGLSSDIAAFLEGEGPVFLLAPNCVGDSATLRVRTVFHSQRRWVEEVCAYFRARPQLRLIIRAHPDELFYLERNKIVIMMGEVAERAAGGAPNIKVIKGSESASTYALIPHAQAGLVWMSTVGVDMAVRNCPVLAAARPKYHGLGIVHEPTSREEYFKVLDRLAERPTGTSEAQKEMGRQYLSVLAREFSYEAFSASYAARDVRLSGHAVGSEFDTFYRVLAGELPSATRPPLRGTAEAR